MMQDSEPYLIAEAGVNYYDIAEKNNIEIVDAAKLMVDEAQKGGADAIKFQSYKASKIASKISPAYWDTTKEPTKSQYELFSKFDKLGEEEYKELAGYCKRKDICFLSTPFDEESVDFLDGLVPVFKISSSDITNTPLLRHIAGKGKPVLLSTGASSIGEIRSANYILNKAGSGDIVIMHCVLSYPTAYIDANLNMIKGLQLEFPEKVIGYSDHTIPDEKMLVLPMAYLLGARVLEKHFTLDKSLPGNDHYHAMDPADLKSLKDNLEFLSVLGGKTEKMLLYCEENSRIYARRSLVAARRIRKGDCFDESMLVAKRPGTGISPNEITNVLGKLASKDISEDGIIEWDSIA